MADGAAVPQDSDSINLPEATRSMRDTSFHLRKKWEV